MKKIVLSQHLSTVYIVLSLGIAVCSVFNLYNCFFPEQIILGHDEAQHLHVAFLLSEGKRPFIDFIENHPLLFNHSINLIERLLSPGTIRKSATAVRCVLCIHFIACLLMVFLWVSRILHKRPKEILWFVSAFNAFAIVGFSNPHLRMMWEIRPDWICYAYTIAGVLLFFRAVNGSASPLHPSRKCGRLILAGFLIATGNCFIPKGVPIVAAALFSVAITRYDTFTKQHTLKLAMRCLPPLTITVASMVCTAVVWVIIDCALSGIDLHTWYKGVISINSLKHPCLTNAETNPVYTIAAVFSFSYPIAIACAIWFLIELTMARPNKQTGIPSIVAVISGLVISNVFIAPFTNALTWSYYYMPLVLASFAMYLTLFLRVEQYSTYIKKYSLWFPHFPIVLGLYAIIFSLMASQPFRTLSIIRAKQIQSIQFTLYSNRDYIYDDLLPADLTYLTRLPQFMPVKAHHWGKYFALMDGTHFWVDFERLFGEQSSYKNWKQSFASSPPDIITLSGASDVIYCVHVLFWLQNYNAAWLIDEIRENYTLMGKSMLKVFIHNSKVTRMYEEGWRKIDSSFSDPFSHFFYHAGNCQ